MRSRLRAATVALLAIFVIAAGVLPSCGMKECCTKTPESTVHRQMPCCDESTIAPRQAVRVLPATSTVPLAMLPAIPNQQPSGVDVPQFQTTHVIASFTPHDPPLFLLNEQFLI